MLIPACIGVWAKPISGASASSSAKTSAKVQATAGTRAPGLLRVDSAKVHALYLEGEFEEAIPILEANLKQTRQYRREDSVFMFKHLGVMYAARNETRERGKYYLHRLLTVEPTAKIMDMYASDMIYTIFQNIQEEFASTRKFLGLQHQTRAGIDSLSAPSDPKAEKDSVRKSPEATTKHSSGGKAWAWSGAAVVTVAAGVGAYFLITEQQPKTVRRGFEY